MNEKERLAQALRDGDMETFTKAIREANAPERLAQRDRLAQMIGQFSDEAYDKPRLGLPSIAEEIAARLIAADVRVGPDERLRAALDKINAIRNSIVGSQQLNWSEHIYPLVAALNEAGFEGLPYPEAKENFGTLLERANKAEAALAALEGSAE